MMTSINGNISHFTGPWCGEFTGIGELPSQRPVTRIFDAFFDLRLNKRLYYYSDLTLSQSFSQWQHSFQWNLRSHWLKVLRQCHIAVEIQGPYALLMYECKSCTYCINAFACKIISVRTQSSYLAYALNPPPPLVSKKFLVLPVVPTTTNGWGFPK